MSQKIQRNTQSLAIGGRRLEDASGMRHTGSVEMILILSRADLRRSERLNYIDAVQCLGKKKARTPAAIAAGAKTRYDDFVVIHIQLTQYTQGNVRYLGSILGFDMLTSTRVIFSHGTDTICGPTSKRLGTSAVTKGIFLTTIMRGGPTTHVFHLF
jgi:hypothetical protein